MRILQLIMLLKGLRVGLLCYMWVNLMRKCPVLKKETCSGDETSKINLNCCRHMLSEVVPLLCGYYNS